MESIRKTLLPHLAFSVQGVSFSTSAADINLELKLNPASSISSVGLAFFIITTP
jgi:hypothetical protein